MYESDEIIPSVKAKQVFETPDLVRLIYSFGDPGHRRLTQIITQEIGHNPTRIRDEFMKRREHVYEKQLKEKGQASWWCYSIYDYMRDLPRVQLLKHLSACSRCHCCQRHSINKPSIYGNNGTVIENYKSECECNCRNLTRRMSEFINF
jgi:hypothetical protein